jgi:hypothetical protein
LNCAPAIEHLRNVCERWIYLSALVFALSPNKKQHGGFNYQYSVFQLELSRNLLSKRGTTMDEVYQKLIDRTRAPLDLKQMKTIFGHSHRPYNPTTQGRKPAKLVKTVQAPSYNLTVFKIKWGNLTLKIYDKGVRVLRIEVVVLNAKELRCGKVLEKLPVLLERMNGILVRFLDTVQAAHVAFLDECAFDAWNEPTVRNAAYHLAKLRGKRLVHAAEYSRRYRADPSGVRTMCAYLVLRDKVIKPLLIGVVRPLG